MFVLINKNKKKYRILIATSLILAVFLLPFSTKANSTSEFVPAPEVLNIKQNQILYSNDVIYGTSLNFSQVQVKIDGEFIEHAQAQIGTQGWQDWRFTIPDNLSFGQHTLEFTTLYFNNTQSPSTFLNFFYQQRPVGPTLFDPVVNSETNWQQPWIVGLAGNDSIINIYLNGEHDGQAVVKNSPSGTASFRYLPSQKLDSGFYSVVAQAISLDQRESLLSNEIIFEVRNLSSQLSAPGFKNEIGEFLPPVPAPTLLTPQNSQVIFNRSFQISGLVHNEHYVKIYIDHQLATEFMPDSHLSGVTSFIWQLDTPLTSGSHEIWAKCINLRGQVSGQSNILKVIIPPVNYFVSYPVGKIAAASEQSPASDIKIEIISDQEVESLVNKITSWADRWTNILVLIILIVIILTLFWIILTLHTKKKNKFTLSGPEINYDKLDGSLPADKQEHKPDFDENFNNQDENSPPPMPPIDSPGLGI